ncbi:MAG: hypothetical protein ACTSSG_07115 [Candidatus Heimdallarchaeaceae archaeon]
MSYNKLNKVCDELNMEFLPIFNSVELKGDKILLYREKFAEEIEKRRKSKKGSSYKISNQQLTYEEIDEIIEKLRNYFKEKMIIFYKSAKMRGKKTYL